MIDFPGIVALVKGITDIASTSKDVKIADAVREKTMALTFSIADLQTTVSSLQIKNQELASTINTLEQERGDLKHWKREAKNDSLHQLAPGVFVCSRQLSDKESNHTVQLCPNCYEDRVKSILQFEGTGGEKACFCPKCSLRLIDNT